MSNRTAATVVESGAVARLAPTRLVDIVSGSFGAGHDSAARELAGEFHAHGYTTRIWDIVDLFPARLGELLRAVYLRQIRSLPGSWELLLARLEPGSLFHRLAGRGLDLPADGLLEIAAARPEVIVSTHPFASQALGRLRADGRLDIPVVTYLTDMSVHPLWVHPSVDLHLALHEIPAAHSRKWNGTTTVVEPLVPSDYARRPPDPRPIGERRRELGLPVGEPLALVTGGSLGIGQLARAAADISATGLARPVVLCGQNSSLYRRLGMTPSVVRLGWRDDLPDVLRAVDCVVQNSGGFTSLETLAAGTPALSYRCLPGHGTTNADALDQAGLIPWVRSRSGLPDGLALALSTVPTAGPRRGPAAPDVIDAVFPARVRVPA